MKEELVKTAKCFAIAIGILLVFAGLAWGAVIYVPKYQNYQKERAAQLEVIRQQYEEREAAQAEVNRKNAERMQEQIRQQYEDRAASRNADERLARGILLFLFVASIYFIPSYVAYHRKPIIHNNFVSILMLNIFAGWTIGGWVACLVWATINK